MRRLYNHPFKSVVSYLSIGVFTLGTLAFAQDGWKRVGEPPAPDQGTSSYPDISQAPNNQSSYQQQAPQQPPYQQAPYQQAPYQQPPYNQPSQQPNYPPPASVPAQLTIPAGTFITVRVNQFLSSDRNQAGDAFSASLEQPIVVNGIVVAEPGQTIGGRVGEAVKAGRIEGVSRLGIQLTTLTLVDGQQIPINCQLVSRQGPTSVGQDAGVIAGTTALGAALGAAAGWGRGAAIGAGAGAAAGLIGVLITRGHPSVITPEQLLTFRLEAPVTIFTQNSPQAFRYVQPGEYDRPRTQNFGPSQFSSAAPPPPASFGYPYPSWGFGYPSFWGPSFWGPSFAFSWGPGYWWGGRWFGGPRFVSSRAFVVRGGGFRGRR